MLTLKMWERFEYTADGGQVIAFSAKRLNFAENGPFVAVLQGAWAAMGSVTLPTLSEQPTPEERSALLAARAEANRRFYEALPSEMVAQAFRDWIRNVEGLATEEGEITTGEALFKIADYGLAIFVMGCLNRMAKLSEAEGKAFASPSTSGAAGTVVSSGSPAPSIESEAGPAPSTAMETS